MRIYALFTHHRAQRLEPVYDREPMKKLKRNVPERCTDWPGLRLTRMPKAHDFGTDLSDVTAVGLARHFPLCAPHVRETLTHTCGVEEQWLDVTFDEREYSLLNLIHVVDALDHERATKKYFKSSGHFDQCSRYAFHLDAVENEWLFRDKTDNFQIFCTPRFAELVEREGWTGLRLEPVWDTEHEPFMYFPTKSEILSRPEIFGPKGFIEGFEEVWPDEWHQEKALQKKNQS